MKNMLVKRREALLAGLFGAEFIGLRALATGLPAWFIANPGRANAQSLQCAIEAKQNMQYLILSASSQGDPLNCNTPGTYEAPEIIHPLQPTMAPSMVTLGGKVYGAALPWVGTDVGGALSPATLSRIGFFHYSTRSTVHGDQPKVMKLLGQTSRSEMLVSAYAKHLSTCFGTVQAEPVAVGARGNSSELVSFAGRTLPSISPTQLKQLLTGTRNNPLLTLRTVRDASLAKLSELAKTSGSPVQKRFLDTLATSRTQVRQLADALATTLNAITSDDARGQALAAAALISANVTPVVTMHINFGGDNHTDTDLTAEATQTVSGVQGIQALMDALAGLGLSDKVTFATMNVFGRNLNGIAKTEGRTGRDHYGNHAVSVMIGKNIAPGVTGGVLKGSGGAYSAADIDSATGLPMAGGDIPVAKSNVALARTLGVALGIPTAILDTDLATTAGGKVVNTALAGVTG
ncbi:MAG: DUF1501 domain-containing protein [Deltaproteobacteria bacterium]|nr:DUF1501 domain-containing protein [Deltaproteobacteria bacterium]